MHRGKGRILRPMFGQQREYVRFEPRFLIEQTRQERSQVGHLWFRWDTNSVHLITVALRHESRAPIVPVRGADVGLRQRVHIR